MGPEWFGPMGAMPRKDESMSQDEYIRRTVEERMRDHPSMQKRTEQEVPDYETRMKINNAIDQVRDRQNQK
jgi:hypothetical protein